MLWTFALMCIILALTPGPDNIFVATQSMAYGSRTGWMITLGLLTGCLWHTSLLAFGFTAVIDRWPEVFTAVKVLGGGYLLYMAFTIWRSHGAMAQSVLSQHRKRWWFVKGIVLNTTNPKVYLFFLSFFPAFLWDQTLQNPYNFCARVYFYRHFRGDIWPHSFAERFTRMRDWLVTHPQTFKGIQAGIFALLGLYILSS